MRSVSRIRAENRIPLVVTVADLLAQRQGIVEAFYDDTVTRSSIRVSHLSAADQVKRLTG